ncbi:single-stranded DNA-binding protein [Nonomuraea rubra]|uniref:single-stranded DNA-binding protein n=1 Tax=Nonomuraea rubra TaxID=46180 RepID=UPI0033D6F34D
MSGETTITIIGNLTADPEMRFTPTGVAVARFTIASTTRTYDKQTNQWRDGDQLFLWCTAWRDLAEHVCESLIRGTRVIASGRLRTRNYDDKDGIKRTATDLTVEEIGPSLRFATAKPVKADRTHPNGNGSGAPADDPWSSDEPPF